MIHCRDRFQARRYPEPRREEGRRDHGCGFEEGGERNCLHGVKNRRADRASIEVEGRHPGNDG